VPAVAAPRGLGLTVLIIVAGLVEPQAKIEIETTAVVPA